MTPLAADLSQLPTGSPRTEGEPPDANPRFVHLLVQEMAQRNFDAGDKPTARGTRIRHSDAGKCARAIAYTAAGIPKSDPMDLPGTWVTSLGTLIHEAWQEALRRAYPDAEIEPKLGIDGLDASGHADAVLVIDGRRLLYELKSTGGFGYKLKVGERGPAQGPSHEHKLQAALNGVAVDADEVVIGYLATECISKAAADRKNIDELTHFAAEWSYPREVFEPWAEQERKRLQRILDLLDERELAPRMFATPELPKGHEIVDPSTGRWEVIDRAGRIADTGTWWACGYCAFQSLCATTKPGRIPLADVTRGAA
jgi:hypothetical protein